MQLDALHVLGVAGADAGTGADTFAKGNMGERRARRHLPLEFSNARRILTVMGTGKPCFEIAARECKHVNLEPECKLRPNTLLVESVKKAKDVLED